jgi:hypothetical protein
MIFAASWLALNAAFALAWITLGLRTSDRHEQPRHEQTQRARGIGEGEIRFHGECE